MARMLWVCALLAALPAPAAADEPKDKTWTDIHLTAQPMAAPHPALRYQLLPELRELNPGNPIQAYLKCFMEQQTFYFNKTSIENRDKWLTLPLSQLPLKELRSYGGASLRQADWAARLDTPDWQILLQAKKDGANLLLPDLQQLRTLANALKVRFRAEIAGHRYGDAVETAKTMFALARHCGTHPTLIGDLVAVAIATVAIGPLEEMIQQPGSPNFVWALAFLPDPLIDIHPGIQGEHLIVLAEFSGLDERLPQTEPQLDRVVNRLHELVKSFDRTLDARAVLLQHARDAGYVEAARKRLAEIGLAEEQTKSFPALQVVLLDEEHIYQGLLDDQLKWFLLPYWQAEAGLTASARERTVASHLFVGLLPMLGNVRAAPARLQQRLRLLRCVEALRLYAAAHDGNLPAKLADTHLPLPLDPVSGKPFVYQVEGQAATLHGEPFPGKKVPGWNIRYLVTIKK